MSIAEIAEEMKRLTFQERSELRELLDAEEEGVSVEELRAIRVALAEAEQDFEIGAVYFLEEIEKRHGLT